MIYAAQNGHDDVVEVLVAADAGTDCGWYRNNVPSNVRTAFRQISDDSASLGDDLFG